jgi:hypothetical protein
MMMMMMMMMSIIRLDIPFPEDVDLWSFSLFLSLSGFFFLSKRCFTSGAKP